MSIRTIIFGATGMVGEGVLHVALNHQQVESVLVIGRRPCGISHHKLQEIVHSDFYNFSSIETQLSGYNACYFCLGVTSIGKNEQEYARTTYDLTMHVAVTLSRLNPEMTFCYVSGSGTDSTESGKTMWARVKGKTENDLMKLPFKAVFNFRPGFIKPMKGLKNALPMSTTIGRLYPFLKNLFPNFVCTLEEIGRSMIRLTIEGYPTSIIDNNTITALARQK
ncbi:MAG: NAD-dependent epimerase/dehydratase family protein [Bacteroidota bacterium]